MREQLSVAMASVVTVNCMAVSNMDMLYEKLAEDLGKELMPSRKSSRGRKLKEAPFQALDRLLSEHNTKW